MEAKEAKQLLISMWRNTTEEKEKTAIWLSIRAIDTCLSNGFNVVI